MSTTDDPHRIRNRLWIASVALGLTIALAVIGGMIWWSTAFAENHLDEELYSEVVELIQGPHRQGQEALATEIRRRVLATDSVGQIYLYAESQQTIIEGTWSTWPDEIQDGMEFQTFGLEDVGPPNRGLTRQVRIVVRTLPSGQFLAVGQDVTEHIRLKRSLQLGAAAAAALALGIAIAGGIMISRGLLARVMEMREVVSGILRGRRNTRVPVHSPRDEFDQLAEHFNQLLDENQALLQRMREVTNEIAHDLRTPLARMRAQIESHQASTGGESEHRELFHDLREELDDILDTFNALLHIAQIETGRAQEEMVCVDMTTLVEDVCELYEPVADEGELELRSRTEPAISVIGNRHLLAQALTNLIENALKYAGRGVVAISLSENPEDRQVTLSVTDQGPGIPEEAQERVLQRFARLESARNRPGAGLGLSFVAAVAELHRASLELQDMSPGLRVTLRMQGAPANPDSTR